MLISHRQDTLHTVFLHSLSRHFQTARMHPKGSVPWMSRHFRPRKDRLCFAAAADNITPLPQNRAYSRQWNRRSAYGCRHPERIGSPGSDAAVLSVLYPTAFFPADGELRNQTGQFSLMVCNEVLLCLSSRQNHPYIFHRQGNKTRQRSHRCHIGRSTNPVGATALYEQRLSVLSAKAR